MTSETINVLSERDKARVALTYIDPNCDRETWVRMAAALKDEFGQDGFELFDEWSRDGKRYQEAATRDTWKSIRPGKGITIASLYHEAKNGGFRPAEWKTQAPAIRPNDSQRAAERAAAEAAQAAEDARRHAEAAKKAVEVFRMGKPLATDHPYITRKGLSAQPWLQNGDVAPREISAEELAKHLGYKPKANDIPLAGRVLLIPMIDGRNMTTLEFIDEQGRKTALAGGIKKGAWSTPLPMGKHLGAHPDTPIVVVEGWATAYSVQHAFLRGASEMPSAYVVAAGADTNLGNVVRALHSQHPEAPIVVGADIGNPKSMELATEAARSVGGCVMAPQFTDEQFRFLEDHLGKAPTDFNDQLVYYVENRVPQEGFDNDMTYAMSNAVFPDPAPDVDASRASRASHSTREADASTGDRTMENLTDTTQVPDSAPATPTYTKREPGKQLYNIQDIPLEIRDVAQSVFGKRHTLYSPRENGGPYNGEVYNTQDYLIQEVGSRSLVIHDKSKLSFAGERLQWMNDNQRLNGHELSVYYNDDKAKVYPFDRVRDELDRAVGSFKKSAKELGLPPEFAVQIDEAFNKSMERIQGLRKEAQAKAKEARSAADPAEKTQTPKR